MDLGERPAKASVDRAWFDRPATDVARDLLGCTLVHDSADGRVAGRIVEVEAYQGPEDRAAHSWRGPTPRNAVMFGPPGHLYVYLIYGLHQCANVVCGPGTKPEAVLLRAAEVTEGLGLARRRRGPVPDRRLAAGPGNLGAAFGFDRGLNGADLLDGPVRILPGTPALNVTVTPRIGVAYAGAWADRPLRFLVTDDPHRSRR
ncbi:MAG TPA: DNA-3-methyladenine glycosylase [Candidatus Limnocylindria bacterium]|nr:DNA-3-methyladenine glycosylase [Candidatus Limnocylindria bacterium]